MSTDTRDPLLLEPSSLSHLEHLPSGPHTHADPRYAPGPEIGRGGMGRVRLIEDTRLHRDLAWKEGNASVLREAWVTAQLEHPGILPVHDLGTTDDGQSFFAMRIVRGDTLADVLRDGDTSAATRRARLRLLLQATQAVAWAHHRGVVHRDLKPANVLVGPFGEVQVIDWGLAAVLDDAPLPLPKAARDAIACYRLSGPIGTPGYMAPEQADGHGDYRADVYSLGLVLRSIAGPRPPAELRSITARCLAARPEDRYPDAGHLAADLGAFLDGHRVRAHRYRLHDHLVRFAAHFRLPLLVGGIAALVLAAAVLIANRHVATERDHAIAAQRDTETALHQADAALRRADLALADALANHAQAALLRGMRFDAEILAARALSHADDPRARGIAATWAHGSALTSAPFAPDGRFADCTRLDAYASNTLLCVSPTELRLIELATLETRTRLDRAARLAALSPDGARLLHAQHCTPTLLDLARHEPLGPAPSICPSFHDIRVTGHRALLIARHHIGLVDLDTARYQMPELCDLYFGADVSPDGRFFVLCSDGTLHIGHFDSEHHDTLTATGFARHDIEATSLVVLDDTTLIVADTAGRVRHLALDGRAVAEPIPVTLGLIRTLALSPNGRWLATAGDAGGLVVFDAKTLGYITSLPAALGHRALWLPDSSLVPYAPNATASGATRFTFEGSTPAQFHFTKGVTALAVDREQTQLLVAHQAAASLVGLDHAPSIRRFSGGRDVTKGVSFDRLGHAYFGDASRFFARIEPDFGTARLIPPQAGIRRHVAVGDWLVVVPPRGPIYVAHTDRMEQSWSQLAEPDESPPYRTTWLDLAGWPEGRSAFALGPHAVFPITLDGAPTLHTAIPLPEPDVTALAVFPDETRFAVARGDTVWLWDRDSGAIDGLLRAVDTSPDVATQPDAVDLLELAIHPTGTWVAAGARDGRLFVWRTDTSTPRAAFTAHAERIVALHFLDDALLTGSWDGGVRRVSLAALDAPPAALVDVIERRWRTGPIR